MTRSILTVFAAATVLAACNMPAPDLASPGTMQPAEATKVDPSLATLAGADCPDMGEGGYFFWMEARSAEPGEAVALYPYFASMPGMYESLPAGCVGDVTLSPDGLATLLRLPGAEAYAVIAPDAPPGKTLFISATYGEGRGIAGMVQIYRAADNPLVGTWKQSDEGCPAESAVRELVFTGGGEFSVTWTPFEVYKDFWGTYTYDPVTGAIAFEVESGNQTPADMVLEGTATVTDGVLTFDGVTFGTPSQASGACAAPFR